MAEDVGPVVIESIGRWRWDFVCHRTYQSKQPSFGGIRHRISPKLPMSSSRTQKEVGSTWRTCNNIVHISSPNVWGGAVAARMKRMMKTLLNGMPC